MPLTQKSSASTLLTTVLVVALITTILLAVEYIALTAAENCCTTQLNSVYRLFTGRFQLMNM
jgi:hypothetical protein